MSNKPKNTRIVILCEGKTECMYFKGFQKTQREKLKENNISLEIREAKNNSYSGINNYIQKEFIDSYIFIIIDLDKANKNSRELKNLKELIHSINKINSKSKQPKEKKHYHIFLSYENFEDWLKAHFSPCPNIKNFLSKFNAKSIQDFKSNVKEDLYMKCEKIENAEEYFKNRENNLFCRMEDSNKNKFEIDEKNVGKEQSNLYCFRDLIENFKNYS